MMRNALLLLTILETALAFTACPLPHSSNSGSSNVALHLTPKEAAQLVDAYNAAHPDDEDPEVYHPAWYKHGHTKEQQQASQHEHLRSIATSSSSSSSSSSHGGVSEKARDLVHRLVTLPLTSHPHDEKDRIHEDDVVYYPVIGFTYVPDAADHSRALPTVSNPSCRLVYEQLLDKQEVFGEWHPSPEKKQGASEEDKVVIFSPPTTASHSSEGPQP